MLRVLTCEWESRATHQLRYTTELEQRESWAPQVLLPLRPLRPSHDVMALVNGRWRIDGRWIGASPRAYLYIFPPPTLLLIRPTPHSLRLSHPSIRLFNYLSISLPPRHSHTQTHYFLGGWVGLRWPVECQSSVRCSHAPPQLPLISVWKLRMQFHRACPTSFLWSGRKILSR